MNEPAARKKPFCSLAYLAKSTVAGGGVISPALASTKAAACRATKPCSSPELPTGAATTTITTTTQSCCTAPPPTPTPTLGVRFTDAAEIYGDASDDSDNNNNNNNSSSNANGQLSNGIKRAGSFTSTRMSRCARVAYDAKRLFHYDKDTSHVTEHDGGSSSNCGDETDAAPNVLAEPHCRARAWQLGAIDGGNGAGCLSAHSSGSNSASASLTTPLSSHLNSLDCWDYTIELECLNGPQDLQLAAELGKTLLERNKELEAQLKEHKICNEEQEREILHLRKQIIAMTEVNDSRLKVYEQLEVGIQDLERANSRLTVEKNRDKKQIKTLTHNIEMLEIRIEEINKQLEDAQYALTNERRKSERLQQECNRRSAALEEYGLCNIQLKKSISEQSTIAAKDSNAEQQPALVDDSKELADGAEETRTNVEVDVTVAKLTMDFSPINCHSAIYDIAGVDNEDTRRLLNELEMMKRAYNSEQQRCTELEEQLYAIIQDNQNLQSRLSQTTTTEEVMSMQDEFSILDEVRQGQMCSRCLRNMDDRATNMDDQSSIAPTEEPDEDDERSVMGIEPSQSDANDNASEISSQAGGYDSERHSQVKALAKDALKAPPDSPNPYRDLVEKYEALVEVQRLSVANKNGGELHKDAGSEPASTGVVPALQQRPKAEEPAGKSARGQTPTEFSEAETSSSGYADETSNKCTQTDDRPGYFLCSIGDGDDCKFSIYDDARPVDSHFRNRPEYRELFKEIFAVLRKAAINKEEGDKLPLLDDANDESQAATAADVDADSAVAQVPPVTPANEQPPSEFGDDSQSIVSSVLSEQSFAMSECITKLERRTAKKHIIEKNQENQPPLQPLAIGPSASNASVPTIKQIIENGRVLVPLKREPLEYLGVGGSKQQHKKKGRRNRCAGSAESPLVFPMPPRFYTTVSTGGKRQRKELTPVAELPGMATMFAQAERGGRGSRRNSATSKHATDWNCAPAGNTNRVGARATAAGAREQYEFSINGGGSVSQEFNKLRHLDMSYAEVLRRGDTCEHQHALQHGQRTAPAQYAHGYGHGGHGQGHGRRRQSGNHYSSAGGGGNNSNAGNYYQRK